MILTERISVPDVPSLPGLAFRRFRGAEDYPKMAAVLNAACAADQIERVETVKTIANTYAHLTNSDPYTDMLFAEADGRVVSRRATRRCSALLSGLGR